MIRQRCELEEQAAALSDQARSDQAALREAIVATTGHEKATVLLRDELAAQIASREAAERQLEELNAEMSTQQAAELERLNLLKRQVIAERVVFRSDSQKHNLASPTSPSSPLLFTPTRRTPSSPVALQAAPKFVGDDYKDGFVCEFGCGFKGGRGLVAVHELTCAEAPPQLEYDGGDNDSQRLAEVGGGRGALEHDE